MAQNTFKISFEDGATKSIGVNILNELKFVVTLKRKDNYKGEFGFDWMRSNYKTISNDYENLKKEYSPTTVMDEEYFVPWLSMFPNQKNVSLLLKIKKTNGEKVKNNDIVKLPIKDAIRFEPNEVKLKDLEKSDVDIKVFCDAPITKDTVCDFFDKNNNSVGKLQVFKNDTTYNLNLKIVKVVRSASKQRDLEGINDALKAVDLNKLLNKNSLQQALIKTNIVSTECILELSQETLDNEDTTYNGAQFIGDKKRASAMMKKYYMKKFEQETSHKGLLLFITPITRAGAAGDGQLWAANHRNCSIFYNGLYSKTTYAHEIAHVLGCEHPFDNEWKIKTDKYKEYIGDWESEIDSFNDEIEVYNQKILEAKEKLVKMKQYPNDPIAVSNISILNSNLASYKKTILNNKKAIKSRVEIIATYKERLVQADVIKDSNQHVFTKGSTKENYLDYISPKSSRKSFWQWQWRAMQYDVKTYYS